MKRNLGMARALLNTTTLTTKFRGKFMKALLLSVLVLSSLNIFAAEVGESKAIECEFGNQSKREQKPVESNEEKKKEESKAGAVRV